MGNCGARPSSWLSLSSNKRGSVHIGNVMLQPIPFWFFLHQRLHIELRKMNNAQIYYLIVVIAQAGDVICQSATVPFLAK